MKKIKKTIVVALRGVVLAQMDWTDPSGSTPAPLKDLEAVFANIISVATTLAGIAVLVMLIVGGFQYITAGDDPKMMEKASKTLTMTFVGLILVIAAWFILQVIYTITGLNVTVFRVFKLN